MTRPVCPACGSNTGLGDIHCFKCGYLVNLYKMTDGYLTESHHKNNQLISLEDGIEFNPRKFSPKALQWLYKSCIYDNIIVKQSIGYCAHSNKVLLPAFNADNELEFYQLRDLDTKQYRTYGKTGIYTIHYFDHNDRTVVICEDHLSAMRIRPFRNVVCLSGTSLKEDMTRYILNHFIKVIYWLDPDEPGQDAIYKNHRKMQYWAKKIELSRLWDSHIWRPADMYKVNAKLKTCRYDPKCYLDSEIRDILNNKVVPI